MTDSFDFSDHAHRRRNALTGEWVLVSPHRNKRPWQGKTETPATNDNTQYDPQCYLCPGNQRMGGETNPNYTRTFVFANDFPAITKATPDHTSGDPLFASQSERGECRVLAYSPDHSKTLADLPPGEIRHVIDHWAAQADELGQSYPCVQIFENKGEIMGCSMPHPHGQIWAQEHMPTLLEREQQQQVNYRDTHQSSLLLDYAKRELVAKDRLVAQTAHWLACVPFWAAWPFETLVLPLFPVSRISELDAPQKDSLAELLSKLLIRYDNLFECAFPYSMGWHGAPYLEDAPTSAWQLHGHFYPPLLRSRSVKKFMVGYEMLAEPQRDLTPEQAAKILRELSETHHAHRD